ncbi:MAG: cupredoxin domain-containing protein [Thiotrichaceae bacterium]|nr:cupredoxin domain-containing protein [Thiotrichaceae bacterium]
MRKLFQFSLLALSAAMCANTVSAEDKVFNLVIKNHKFEPAEITVPAGVKIQLNVKNLDSTAEEFESYELNQEKVISGGQEASLYIEPLKPGSYPFVGEFNEDTAKGVLIAK